MKSLLILLIAAFVVMLSGGCGIRNNHLHPVDFVRRLNDDGIKIAMVRPLDPQPLGATEALEVKIGSSSIGVYKLDSSVPAGRQRLERIAQTKRIYFSGIPYPVYEVCGSFFLVGLDKHPEKHRILKSLRKFK